MNQKNNPYITQVLSKSELLKTLESWDSRDIVHSIVIRAINTCDVKTKNELSACYDVACNSWMVDNEDQGASSKDFDIEVSSCQDSINHIRKQFESFYTTNFVEMKELYSNVH